MLLLGWFWPLERLLGLVLDFGAFWCRFWVLFVGWERCFAWAGHSGVKTTLAGGFGGVYAWRSAFARGCGVLGVASEAFFFVRWDLPFWRGRAFFFGLVLPFFRLARLCGILGWYFLSFWPFLPFDLFSISNF